MTHDIVSVWHVYARGEWHAISHDGYRQPVIVEIDGHIVAVDYAHMEFNCHMIGGCVANLATA